MKDSKASHRTVVNDDDYFLHAKPLEIGDKTQLLLDPSCYSDRWDMTQVINQPAKVPCNPVVIADQPWEYRIGLPNVLYDQEKQIFKMWYAYYDSGKWGYERWGTGGSLGDDKGKRYSYMISYAESPDGIHWQKPLFDKIPYMGFNKTNIVFTGNVCAQEFHVQFTPDSMRSLGRFMLWYRDAAADPERNEMDLMLAFSEDGINWREYEQNPVYQWTLDAEHSPVYDEDRDLWLLYARPQQLAANEERLTGENVRTRISVTVSRDLKNWTPMRHVIVPDELDSGTGDNKDQGYFFDRMSVIRHGNQFIGFLTVQPRHGSGRGYIELTSSSDGIHWHRAPKRRPFLAPGRDGDWDGGHNWMMPNLVSLGHWIYMYYVGSSRPWRVRYPEKVAGIGLARIRKDRFVGQYGGPDGGYLLSREVKVTGNRLVVNVSPEHRAFSMQEHGGIYVELLDRTHGPARDHYIAGYGQDDCDIIGSDDCDQVVSWKGNPDLSPLMDKSIYIRFFVRSAYLFGFRFANV